MKRRAKHVRHRHQRNDITRSLREVRQRAGKVKYAMFAWLLGLPLPIILIALFFRGCDF